MRRDRNRNGERGATLVEVALSFTLFMTVVLGVMEFGRLVWTYNTISDLAREGARFASCHGSASKAPADTAAVRAVLLPQASGLNATDLSVNVTWSPNNNPKSLVTVVAQYQYSPMLPLVPPTRIQSASRMEVSW